MSVTINDLMQVPAHLQRAWEIGDGNELKSSINTMFELEGLARELMEKPRPDGSGNYCPDFRLTSTEVASSQLRRH